jgi:hypothetical protein
VIALVEGETEETFVNEVLSPHLVSRGYNGISARRMGFSPSRGGVIPWSAARRDILRHLKEDRDRLVTTMVDYYALPKSWPGRSESNELPFVHRAPSIEANVHADVAPKWGGTSTVADSCPLW